MNLEQLEYIVEVAKTKSLAVAASQLHVSQSAISQAISRLEEELGIKLFTRSRLGTETKPEGRRIVSKALEVLHKLREIREEALSHTETIKGELRVAAIPGLMTMLVKTVSGIKKEYPELRIEITDKGSEAIVDDIRHNKTDLGLIAMYENDARKEGLLFEPLMKGKLMLCASSQSPLAAKKSISPQELQNQTLVLYRDEFIDDFVADFNRAYGPLNILFTTNNGEALGSALTEQLAVTIGHTYSFIHYPAVTKGKLVMLDMDRVVQRPVQFGWIRSEQKHLSLATKHFIARFLAEVRALPEADLHRT